MSLRFHAASESLPIPPLPVSGRLLKTLAQSPAGPEEKKY